MTRIEVPFPPPLSACFNHITKWSKKQNRWISTEIASKRYKEWQVAAHRMLRTQSYQPMLDQEVSILIRLVAPNRVERDGDNHGGKAIYDLLKSAEIITDDSNRYARMGTWVWAKSGPPCVVYVRPFEDAE